MKNFRIKALTALVLAAAMSAVSAEREIKITGKYLNIPVLHSADRARFVMQAEGMPDIPLDIRLARSTPDYWVFKDMSDYKGKILKISCEGEMPGLYAIYQSDTICGANMMYAESNRPQFHFTTRRGWINDPNGLIYYNGEYHLFYQHNPYEREWGNVHWGHAVSRDLIHWTELNDALYPDTMGTMFSGSAVIDYGNDSGFGKDNNPAMIAAYTAETGERQVQCIAYSLDNGRTFTKYENNPVIDSKDKWDSRDTRDPKVFKHNGHWVMVLNERDGHSIYTSDNLRDWTYRSHTTGFWECPDLFELAIDGDKSKTLWVMYGASGTYMLGNFDGCTFTPVSGKHHYSTGSIYAAQTFNNIPDADGRRIQLCWGRLSHPGMPFNGMMLLPTELTLRTTKDGVRLVSVPVDEIDNICHPAGKWANLSQDDATRLMQPFAAADGLRIKARVHLSHATDAYISLNGQRLVDYDMNGNNINGQPYSPQDPTSMTLDVDIFIDRTSVEIFVDGGLFSYSFGREKRNADEGFVFGGNRITVDNLEVFNVESIWKN